MPVSRLVVCLLQTSLNVELLEPIWVDVTLTTLLQLAGLLQDQLSQLGRVNFGEGFAFDLTDF